MDSDQEECEVNNTVPDEDKNGENAGKLHDKTKDEEIPLLRLESAAVQSSVQQDSNNYYSEAPPPSAEKNRRRRRKMRVSDGDEDFGVRGVISDDLSRRSGLELEVEKLLDNSNRWRKSHQARIRTPVRRAVLSYGGVSPGRRQQVFCDLNAKVRELEVAALSRGIACSLQTVFSQQEAGRRLRSISGGGPSDEATEEAGARTQDASSGAGEGLTSRLDPRVRGVYQMLPRQNGHADRSSQEATVAKQQDISSWHDSGRLQSRGRSRATGGFVRDYTTATTTCSSGYRPQRAKTSFTMSTAPLSNISSWAAATSVTKADLLRLQTINGEVQRSLYTERTPGLRRLLHSGGDSRRAVSIGGICGVGAGSLNIPGPQDRRREKGFVCPPATATGVSRIRLATNAKRV